mmetsp:Transcript_47964/g.58079  ORF Transcript_47964/g.58079 Transcript_47964/m.58079 type:complete len:358 (+) Transcript_47964:31-1104(+)|eukprot:CAMPEP_0172522988 /NCGR_PEP_ID=MMETSP1066-20121228/293422_1 /TAXON_ID=671091 /ORGANISM="Coscinodiscus wailesii, Strain CCMP2513" /LENGTH=357 /DNA_ID=CAMNT_0013306033 /DNA_START=583 /DNA_END=1653 /DNA_ORIENTATION=+
MIPGAPGASYQLEERIYFSTSDDDDDENDIVRKRIYVLRGTPSTDPLPPRPSDDNDGGKRRRVTRVGKRLFTLQLDEVTDMTEFEDGGPGTGGNAWDSALAMALFFAARPDLLRGRCLELGSGVGLGGIMSTIAAGIAERDGKDDTPSSSSSDEAHRPPSAQTSLTLTDSNLSVLAKCIQNAKRARLTPHITQLNWYDRKIPHDELHSYDTVLASDCAYLYPDVKPLARTMAYLLATQEEGGRVCHFGPYQRDAVRDLQTELERRYRMEVDLGLMEMDVFVMEPVLVEEGDEEEEEQKEEGEGVIIKDFVSKVTKEFLFIDAMHNEAFYGDGDMFFREEEDEDGRNELEPQVEYKGW